MKKLIEKLIGQKYYIVVIFDGIHDFVSSTPFKHKHNATIFIKEKGHLHTMRDAKIYSFRTRNKLSL